uniref:Uncharacterized protein n=1 Tax=Glossina austeni TaxID=7395 RepID=A0A1A9VUJ9_GLOAU
MPTVFNFSWMNTKRKSNEIREVRSHTFTQSAALTLLQVGTYLTAWAREAANSNRPPLISDKAIRTLFNSCMLAPRFDSSSISDIFSIGNKAEQPPDIKTNKISS